MAREERPMLPLPEVDPLVPPEGFVHALEALGVRLPDERIAKIGDFLARLLAMNERMNLTAIDEPSEAWARHALDSLSLLPCLAELGPGARLIDIGSGGGLPGIPIAIARPELRVTLVEATQKKAAFLRRVSEALGLTNVAVRAERAEALRGKLSGSFDAVTARAVSRMETLVPLTVPFAKGGGLVLLIKGQRAEEELGEAKAALAKHRTAHEATIATPTGRIVVLRRAAAA
jgi:16S rRNA (guanine527-N7)-methyltransferase